MKGLQDKAGSPAHLHCFRVGQACYEKLVQVHKDANIVETDLRKETDTWLLRSLIGFMHDLLEDTNTSIWELEMLDPFEGDTEAMKVCAEDGSYVEINITAGWEYVLTAVIALTRKEGESYMTYIKRLAENEDARIVKLYDLQDNMDITRLKKLSKEDFARLQKYLKAYHFLVDYPLSKLLS